MEIFVFWLLLALAVAIAAGSRGRNGFGWFILSVLLSPLIGLILVLVLPNIRQEHVNAGNEANRGVGSGPFEPEGVYGDIPYRVRDDGSIEAMMQGGVVRFGSADHFVRALGGGSATHEAAPGITNVPYQKIEVVSSGKVFFIVCLIIGSALCLAWLVNNYLR